MTIRTIIICISIAIAASVNLKCASTNIYKSFPSVKIVTPGDIYSTYSMSNEEMEQVRAAATKAKMDPEYVMSRSHETKWPTPLNDFSYRIDNPNAIQGIKARIFTDLGDEKYLLIAPASENKGSALNIKEDIFLVFKKSAVQKK